MNEHWMLNAFHLALSVCLAGTLWWRKDTNAEDEMVAAAHDLVLDTISDADAVTKIDTMTGQNVRDQLTVEEAIAIEQESRLRKWGFGRN